MMKKTEVFKLFGGTPRSVAKALDITVPTVYAWGDEVSRQTIDRIVTVLFANNPLVSDKTLTQIEIVEPEEKSIPDGDCPNET